jgi:hypothetical protein
MAPHLPSQLPESLIPQAKLTDHAWKIENRSI